jgi:hypothetical protein
MGGTSNGTIAAPTQTTTGQDLFKISGVGYTGTGWTGGAALTFVATDNFTASTRGTNVVLTAIAAGQAGGTNLTWNGSTLNANGTTLTGNTGTVTSVGGTGTVNGLTLTGTVTTSGNLTLGGTLSGINATNFAVQGANLVLAGPNGSGGTPTFRSLVAADIPTLNQNTTGTAGGLSATLAISSGGTGQTTRQDAMDALAGSVTSGQYLRGNGTDVVMSTIQAADVPTLNQNTTGTAAGLSATLAVGSGGTGVTTSTGSGSVVLSTSPTLVSPALGTPASGNLQNCTFPTLNQNTTGTAAGLSSTLAISSGGTGQTTAAAAITALTGTQTAGRYLRSDGTNAALAAIQAADVPTLNQNTTGTAAGLSATLAVGSGGTGVTTSTGSGSVVLSNSPTLVTPALGTPASGNLANCSFPTLNQNSTGSSGSIANSGGWNVTPSGTKLYFNYNGTNVGSLDSSGNFIVTGNVTAYGTA